MAACSTSGSDLYLTTLSGWPAIDSYITINGKRLSEFPEIKELLGKGYLSKTINGIVSCWGCQQMCSEVEVIYIRPI